jgi:hypothetical protein
MVVKIGKAAETKVIMFQVDGRGFQLARAKVPVRGNKVEAVVLSASNGKGKWETKTAWDMKTTNVEQLGDALAKIVSDGERLRKLTAYLYAHLILGQ